MNYVRTNFNKRVGVTVIAARSAKERYKNLEMTKPPPESSITNDIPGLNLVFDKNQTYLYRAFWLFFLLICAALCAYQAYDRVVYYLEEPLRNGVDIIRMKFIKFPSITVCPGHGQYPLLINKTESLAKIMNVNRCDVQLSDILEYSVVNMSDLWNLTSISKNLFAGFYVQNLNNIQPKMIVEELDTRLGRCQTYHFPIPINFYEFTATLSIYVSWTNLCPDGKNIATIHPEEDDPIQHQNPLTDFASLGISIYYSMKLTIYHRIGLRRRQCADKFAVSTCHNKCYTEAIGKSVSCRTPHLNLTHIPYCANKQSLDKMYMDILMMEKDFNIYENCSHCKIKCNEYMYGFTHGAKQTPAPLSAQHYYFENNLVNVITENLAYPVVTLLCDMGGNVGLYLGLCLVTIAQLIHHVFWSILRIRVPKGSKNVVRKIFNNKVNQ